MWLSITDLGDSAVGITLAALVLLALLACGWRRAAAAWVFAICGCGAAIAALKLAWRVASPVCDASGAGAFAFSPSGHAALSTAVYGGLAVLSAHRASPFARVILAAGSALLIGLIATSRVAVQAHSPIEVFVGFGVGASAVIWLLLSLRRAPQPGQAMPQLAFALVLSLATMYGTHWPVEQNLHRLAAWLHPPIERCPA